MKQRNNDFMNMMSNQVWNMIHNNDLSKEILRNVFKEILDAGLYILLTEVFECIGPLSEYIESPNGP